MTGGFQNFDGLSGVVNKISAIGFMIPAKLLMLVNQKGFIRYIQVVP